MCHLAKDIALWLQVQQVQQAVASGTVAPKVVELAAAEEAPASAAAGEASVSGAAPHDPSEDYPSVPAADASAEAGPTHAGRIASGAAVVLFSAMNVCDRNTSLVRAHVAQCSLSLFCFCAAR